MSSPILEVEDVHIHFQTYAGTVKAAQGMSFSIAPGEIFGLVGESGCGKSVTGLSVLRMIQPPEAMVGGSIRYRGENLALKSEREMNVLRGGNIAMIFQDPYASLNPVFTVGVQIEKLLRRHCGMGKKEAKERALEVFREVGLPTPERIYDTYPFQLSGGMQQRVMIALAVSTGADLLIADEPTTALDVTIQAQILELLVRLRDQEKISILLITHDLGVVAETCDRVGVAYAGRIVESGTTEDVLYNSAHPYTKGLLGALPDLVEHGESLSVLDGTVPDGISSISGCPFHPRCSAATDVCRGEVPDFFSIGGKEHKVACLLLGRDV